MTLTIDLTPEQEARLQAEADARGVDPAAVLRDLVEDLPSAEKPKTGAEAIAYWEREGLFNPDYGDPNLDGPEMARDSRRPLATTQTRASRRRGTGQIGVILDTDVVIDLYRKLPAARAWLASLPDMPLLAGLAAMELLEGAADRREMRDVRRFLFPFTLSWPTEADMLRAPTSYQPFRLSHGIEMVDCLIAATATGLGEELATFNRRHFRAVPRLVTVQPYTR